MGMGLPDGSSALGKEREQISNGTPGQEGAKLHLSTHGVLSLSISVSHCLNIPGLWLTLQGKILGKEGKLMNRWLQIISPIVLVREDQQVTPNLGGGRGWDHNIIQSKVISSV